MSMETKSIYMPPLAIVTGAAKRLGKAIALELSRSGYAIGIHYYHSGTEARLLKCQLDEDHIPSILLRANLTSPTQIKQMFEKVRLSNYPLTVLINSASIMTKGNLLEITTKQWDHIFNLNLRAAWLCIKEASKIMVLGGQIINITDSGAGRLWTSYAAYSISKAGLEVLTRMAAKSFAPTIRVNAIAPGLILPNQDMARKDWEQLIEKLPLKKSGSPEDISRAVRYLLENEHITGHTLVIDGGYQLVSS